MQPVLRRTFVPLSDPNWNLLSVACLEHTHAINHFALLVSVCVHACARMFKSEWASVFVFTPPRNRGGVIFSLQFVSVCVCVSVCLSVCPDFLWTKFQPNGCTDLDAVFTKWLLTTLARSLLKLVTLGRRSRSRWPKLYEKMMKKKSPKIQI